MNEKTPPREGSLEAPTRHPLNWQSEHFYDQKDLFRELERIYDICHGCRRCVSLCQSFPTLFDLVDESETMEVDGIAKTDYWQVVDQCYLCDMCYMTKCPYVPPHQWNVDFPHLMLRAKAVRFRQNGASFRDRTITDTDRIGKLASLPAINVTVNHMNKNAAFRSGLESALGIHRDAPLPEYHSKTLDKQVKSLKKSITSVPAGKTRGKIALFATCYGTYNSPHLGKDFFKVFQHNNIHIELVNKKVCCGMPKLELGDLEAVRKNKEFNIPKLAALVEQGYDLTAPIPSCVLMFKQELPLMFPDDEQVKQVQEAFYDPFEYLFLRYKSGQLNTNFTRALGDISYQVACHLRVQKIGLKTRDILQLIPDTTVHTQERCSGHDGTYAVKKETYELSKKIARPVVRKVDSQKADFFSSDCPMAGNHIANLSQHAERAEHPMTLLRHAYGI